MIYCEIASNRCFDPNTSRIELCANRISINYVSHDMGWHDTFIDKLNKWYTFDYAIDRTSPKTRYIYIYAFLFYVLCSYLMEKEWNVIYGQQNTFCFMRHRQILFFWNCQDIYKICLDLCVKCVSRRQKTGLWNILQHI